MKKNDEEFFTLYQTIKMIKEKNNKEQILKFWFYSFCQTFYKYVIRFKNSTG